MLLSIYRLDNISTKLGKLSQINDGGKMDNEARHVKGTAAFGSRFCVSDFWDPPGN